MNLNSFALLAMSFTLALSHAARAADIYVTPATGSNVSASELKTATELVKLSVPDVSTDEVVEESGKADYVLKPKLIRLGETFVLSLTKTKKGKTVFSSQLKATHKDELDRVARDLTRSVMEEKKITESPVDATPSEGTSPDMHQAMHPIKYLGFGGSSFNRLNSSGFGYSFAAAFGWDTDQALIKILTEADFNGSAFFLNAGLGGNYFFNMRNIAPYLTADFGGGLAKLDAGGILSGQTIGGFVLAAGAGIQFLRTAEVNLDIGFRAAFMLNRNALGAPQVFTLRLGLFF
jgi:hypothetical protein